MDNRDVNVSKTVAVFVSFLIGAYICGTKEIKNDIDTTSKMEG